MGFFISPILSFQGRTYLHNAGACLAFLVTLNE